MFKWSKNRRGKEKQTQDRLNHSDIIKIMGRTPAGQNRHPLYEGLRAMRKKKEII